MISLRSIARKRAFKFILKFLKQVITQRLPEAVVRGERNASVKQLRLRLASVKSIQRITKVRNICMAIC